jgi:hypothetical protein
MDDLTDNSPDLEVEIRDLDLAPTREQPWSLDIGPAPALWVTIGLGPTPLASHRMRDAGHTMPWTLSVQLLVVTRVAAPESRGTDGPVPSEKHRTSSRRARNGPRAAL